MSGISIDDRSTLIYRIFGRIEKVANLANICKHDKGITLQNIQEKSVISEISFRMLVRSLKAQIWIFCNFKVGFPVTFSFILNIIRLNGNEDHGGIFFKWEQKRT